MVMNLSKKSLEPQETLSMRKRMEETMLDLLKPCAKGSEVDVQSSDSLAGGNSKLEIEAGSYDAKSPSVVIDAGGRKP